jgi:hypothetical protein
MKKIIILFILFSFIAFAQEELPQSEYMFSKRFYFLPDGNNIAMILTVLPKNRDDISSVPCGYIIILSTKTGEVINKFPLSLKIKSIMDFTFSHDSSKMVVLSKDSSQPIQFSNYEEWIKWQNEGTFQLRQYSLIDGKCIWEKPWHSGYKSLGIEYSYDNKFIIGVTIRNTLIIDTDTGELIRGGDNISRIDDINNRSYDISPDGVYFTFWKEKFFVWASDKTVFHGLLEISWYGLRWLYHLGNIPNYVYVWDNINDTLYDKIPVPYEERSIDPEFLSNDNLLIGSINREHKIYSIKNKKIIRNNQLKFSIFGKYPWRGFKTVASPDNKYFGKEVGLEILLLDYENDKLIARFRSVIEYDGSLGPPLGFSPDSKYFVCVIHGGKIIMVECQTGKIIWENNDFAKK